MAQSSDADSSARVPSLRGLREFLGLTLKEMGLVLGVTPQSLSRLERQQSHGRSRGKTPRLGYVILHLPVRRVPAMIDKLVELSCGTAHFGNDPLPVARTLAIKAEENLDATARELGWLFKDGRFEDVTLVLHWREVEAKRRR